MLPSPTSLLVLLLGAALAVLTLPVAVFCVQVLTAALTGLPRRRPAAAGAPLAPRVAVLIPAHDEASGIAATLRNVQAQLRPGDRLLVVADNCRDATAEIARSLGAEVTERTDAERRGKGWALDHGLRHLAAADPPQVVVIVDADCTLGPGALFTLAARAHAEQVPVQATYLMAAPPGSSLKLRIAQFAMIVKNQVRPAGAARLGGPCQLMGTGMAFPWALLQRVSLGTGHIVEDMQLGTELALIGASPRFEAAVRVDSEFPVSAAGAASQRTRWEHGHLQVLFSQAPRLLWQGMTHFRPAALALAADLMVPPLALLVLAVLAVAGLAGLAALAGAPSALGVWGLALIAALGVSVLAAWSRFGRAALHWSELASAPLYAASKLPVYARFLWARQSDWVRTRRRGE